MIPAALASAYGLLVPELDLVLDTVESSLLAALKANDAEPLTLIKRRKTPESIYEKLQTGRYASLRSLEDLIALTVVVRRRSEVDLAIAAINKSALRVLKKVESRAVEPSDFAYREPKLIIAPQTSFTDRHPEVRDISVEVQFTTAVQHALDLATHDFDYKGQDYSWGKFRLVAQLRGMLELVDNMIDNLEASAPLASKSSLVPQKFVDSADILKVLVDFFDEANLPRNMRRLIDNVSGWILAIGWSATDLAAALAEFETIAGWRSLTVADQVLAVILHSELEQLVANFGGTFIIGQELTDACPEASRVPTGKRVKLE